MTKSLAPYSIFAATLAAAGLPIYIHAPKFYVDEFGVGLAALGGVLFGLRLLDVVQDPFFGWLASKSANVRAFAVALAGSIMAVSMLGLFAIAPPIAPLAWFALTLALLFSSFSFLTITFYAQGVRKAAQLGDDGHVVLATWRETGGLLGISLASVLPVALLAVTDTPFALFAGVFTVITILAVWSMRGEWIVGERIASVGFRPVLSDALSRRLLLIALLNATPVAVSSTLFLFFVESRLGAPGWEGPLLLLFFLAAACSAPLWGKYAQEVGAKRALLTGMILSIVAFGGAMFLGVGDVWAFAFICLASGAALGADMTLLPAIFARRLAVIAPEAAAGFGIWSFVSKFTLAFAAVTLLPLLEATGFDPALDAATPEAALFTLSMMYAAVPCALKLIALILLALTDVEETVSNLALQEV